MVSANSPWRHQYYTPEGLKLNPHLKWGLLTFVTRFFVREGFYDSDEGEEGGSATLKLPPNNVEDKIITMVRENPNITRKEIANRLNMTVDGVKYHIKKITASGKIKYVGSSRNGHWETM